MSAAIRVLVVDDQALVRGGFRVLVDSAEDLEVVGEAENGWQAVELVRTPAGRRTDGRPDAGDGRAGSNRGHRRAGIDTRVLMLTTFDLDEYVFGALRAGASGFLLKDTPPADLLAGIRIVARGDSLLAPSVTRHLIEEFVRRPSADRPAARELTGLTEREIEVLSLVARDGPTRRSARHYS